MPIIKRAANEEGYGQAIVSNGVKSHANDPYFVKKIEEAKETLLKVGTPVKKVTTK